MNDEREKTINDFIHELHRLGNGDKARLKRSVGKRLPEASVGAWRVFYHVLPRDALRYHEEETYFLVATLFPLADKPKGKGSFGAAMHRIRPRNDDEARGRDRRMELLLNANGERLAFLLRQAIRLLGDREVPVNWYGLLENLLDWDWDDRRVQNRWARDYFLKEKDRTLLAGAVE